MFEFKLNEDALGALHVERAGTEATAILDAPDGQTWAQELALHGIDVIGDITLVKLSPDSLSEAWCVGGFSKALDWALAVL